MIRPLELDGDPSTVEVGVRSCPSALRCTFEIYARRGDCWVHLGQVGPLMSEPACERGSARGTYCALSGMRLMIHGDAQEYVWPFSGAYGTAHAGSRYVPGPRKQP